MATNPPPPPQTTIPNAPNPTHPQAPQLNQSATFGTMTANPNHTLHQPIITHSHDISDDEDEDEVTGNTAEDSSLSMIHLTITTTTRIHGNNNTISMDPAVNASRKSLPQSISFLYTTLL
jgi:hypothetical protein